MNHGGYSKTLFLQAALYTIIGAFTPVIAVIQSDVHLSARAIVGLVFVGLVSGATSLKAFLSDTFGKEKANADKAASLAVQSGQGW